MNKNTLIKVVVRKIILQKDEEKIKYKLTISGLYFIILTWEQ
jgi:uncharacterized membrane protein (DUF373 family)